LPTIVVTLTLLGSSATCAADDPIVGKWVWFDNNEQVISSDMKIYRDGKKVGEWKKGTFEQNGKEYCYNLIWDEGSIDYLNLGNSPRLEGINTGGVLIHAALSPPVRNRLGAVVQAPVPALVDQLDLPKGQGMLIQDSKSDSPAAKAGLKANDILLQLDGKSVPSNLDDVTIMLNELKPDAPVDAIILRKGRRETVKGIKLGEAKD